MDQELVYRGDRNTAGTALMVISVVGYSMIPLLVASGNGGDNPFLFGAGWRLGVGLGLSVFLFTFFRDVLSNREVLSLIIGRMLTWSMLFVILSQFDYVAFALATRFIDVSVAAILFETWPIFLILLTAILFRGEARYRAIKTDVLLLLVIGFLGFCFVAGSETGDFGNWNDSQFIYTIIGVGVVILAIILTTVSAYQFRWGVDLSRALPEEVVKDKNKDLVDICCVITASWIGNFIASGINVVVGLSSGETIATGALTIALVGGIFGNALGNIAWRAANLMTTNLGINAVSYATPIFSLIWLFLFSQVDIARVDYLIIGAAAIISANLLINFEAEVRLGFKALIVALWCCGTFVYLRDDVLLLLPFDGWLWPRETYLGALGLSATIFILLLTFRVARLAPRTQDEDNRIFALHRTLELLAWRNLISSEASGHVRGIDSARTPDELQQAYTAVKLCFARASDVPHPNADRRLLADAEAQLNMVVHSRQQGLEFGELFSLIIFGGATVVLALLSRPEVYGWTAFLIEVFSTLFPAVIVFLLVNVWDLHRDRTELVLAGRQSNEGFGVIFRDARSRRFERSVSVVIGLLIIAVYAGLLWHKWVA